MLDRTNSPKLSAATRRTSLYPYYAGFSEQFVDSVIDAVRVSAKETVFDPWNGAGTTTTVCSRRGLSSIGVDINPAMRPVAAVRSMNAQKIRAVHDSALSALAKIQHVAATSEASPFSLCNEIFQRARELCPTELHDGLKFGMMAACRAIAKEVRSKNPTWYSLDTLSQLKVDSGVIFSEVVSSFKVLEVAIQ